MPTVLISPVFKKPIATYFPALTGLRACAAYLVFLFHYNPFQSNTWLNRFFNEGHIGVTLFFVLSGLLICLRYIDRVELSGQWLSKYFRNRIARIYPMYFLVTLLTFFLTWLQPGRDISGHWLKSSLFEKVLTVFLNITLLRGFFQDFIATGVLPGWTLTVEETFYFLAPLLLVGLVRVNSLNKYVLLLLYALAILAVGFTLVRIAPHKFGFFISNGYMLNVTFFGRCFEFISGMALAIFMRNSSSEPRTGISWATWLGLAWIGAAMYVAMLGLAGETPTDQGAGITSFGRNILNNFFVPPGIVLLYWGLIYEKTWLRWLLSSKLFDLLGKSSYVFYLIHMGVFSMAIGRYVSHNQLVIFVLLVLASIMMHKFIEEPMHKLIARRK
ncbi:acyltransferase family protein [Hymenobacter cheonanensis]|uniref:acyltransferase family protein n=1 Tax=Hymenobacter sp. CA2-7 TaxID=3063993 RepID=UPI0027139375|nr:acyltransferase [Hymenobacter sp. CA2-7]MDO7884435.1 acyltransferase [Hymenobacter sp. CA2-7]